MIVKCYACEQKNRIPANRLTEGPKCGGCKSVIDQFAYPSNVAAAEFDAAIKAAKKVVVDFWSPTCGPCVMVAPELEKFAEANQDVLVLKVNAAENVALIQRLGIQAVPTFQTYESGVLTKTEQGFMDATQLAEKLL